MALPADVFVVFWIAGDLAKRTSFLVTDARIKPGW